MKLYIILFVCIAFAYGRKLNIRGHLPKCSKSDPQVEKCILDGINKIRPMLTGHFRIDHQDFSSSDGPGTDIKASIKNINARYRTNFRIKHLKVDLQNPHRYTGEMKIKLPHLDLSADYNMQGTLFALYLKSHGKFKGSFNNIVVVVKDIVASPITVDGVEYLRLDDVATQITFGAAHLKLKPADKSVLGREIASYIQSDPTDVLRMCAPTLDENIARLVKQLVNKLLARVPLKDFLID